ncbi:class I SAM-dependent methyltransferase [Paenibacillus provencensis]|uniref:Class I SAM-dependent methyltransferase n=1 Tax=Paenibacillus provencensis TaxID=441151 RepID=A0ABW3PTX2_9BACL|nr:class I SAM-dependent methyltransferase [Paenibacillus sp. MER 78]MCM3129547.1 class I SAM-dependent methyltransferase [Paenibacillus sp. MER 78]
MSNESSACQVHAGPYYKDIVSFLQPAEGERILDVGCGNGSLTARIAAAGAIPTGIDASEEIVTKARLKYPKLQLSVEDARYYVTEIPYDAVFSHAVLHWIKDAPAVTSSIWSALRQGGRFVAEFAASGNIAIILTAIRAELEQLGYEWEGRNPWYHPTIGEYSSLLEQTGFKVIFAQHADSKSPLKGDNGIRNWMDNFSSYLFQGVLAEHQALIYDAVEDRVRPDLYKDGNWMIDISRLRIAAIKQ